MRRTSPVLRTLVSAAACLFALGCGGSDESGAFEPAVPPEDVCALLTSEDVTTILPNPGPGRLSSSGVASGDVWSRKCDWSGDGTPSASLGIFGAATTAGLVTVRSVGPNEGAWEELSGLGERAAYFSNAFGEVGVDAISGSYAVQVHARGLSGAASGKAALVPLVRKVLALVIE